MHVSKLRISSDSTGKLRVLAQKAGLTPNLLCRMAMMVSFEVGPLNQMRSDLEDGQEFNAYTLFGPYQPIFLDMLRYVEMKGRGEELSDDDLLERLKHHIDRGVRQLAVRIKTPVDAALLLSGEVD